MLDPRFKTIVQSYFKRSATSSINLHQDTLFAGEDDVASIPTLTQALAVHDAYLKSSDSYKLMSNNDISEIVDALIESNLWLDPKYGQSDERSARTFVQREFLKFTRSAISGALALKLDPDYSPEQLQRPLDPSIPTATFSPAFSVAWREYADEKSAEWKLRTKVTYEAYAAEFSSPEFIGNKSVHEFTRNDLIRYRNTLCRLPTQRKKIKQYRDKSVSELLEMNIPEPSLYRHRTINESLSVLSSFFQWCHDTKQYLAGDITKNIKLKNVTSTPRAPFSDDDLKCLFDPDHFLNKADSAFKYWIPLIGLYSGARLGEIAQLRLDDIIEQEGIQLFRIHDIGEEQTVKTTAGIRLVPIHQALLDLGFMDYVERIRSNSNGRLFPELRINIEKPSDAASKWFTHYRRAAGVRDYDDLGHEKVFHSFRHTCVTKMQQTEPQHNIAAIQQVIGHEKNLFGSTSIYTHSFPLSTCSAVINSINAEIALEQLKGKWAAILDNPKLGAKKTTHP